MSGARHDTLRRTLLTSLSAGGFAACMGAADHADGQVPAHRSADWFDAKEDFKARGDGKSDDTVPLEAAIRAGSEAQTPVRLPPGVYPISRPLTVPPNTMLIGSAPGLGFGCRIEPRDCAAFIIGGKDASFHCALENFMIWPRGSAPEFIISIDNSYSVTFRNIRIHEAQDHLGRAAVLLLGDPESGGHGRCNNIIWENLIVRNDSGQPHVAVLASKGCGSHRFVAPCLENYAVLFDWQGGQIDLVMPYTERAGRYAVDCNLHEDDASSFLNTFGGLIDCANSGLGCAVRSTTRNFNSFGTLWGATADRAAYVYSLPTQPVNFHGVVPNLSNEGRARFGGIAGWRRGVNFPQNTMESWHPLSLTVPPHGTASCELHVKGVEVGQYWARACLNADDRGTHLSAFVSAAETVTLTARNPTGQPLALSGTCTLQCGAS